MMGLTPKQRECKDFIRAHRREHGIAPTYREIQNAFGFFSKSGARQLVQGLVERGHVVIAPGARRILKVVEPKDDHSADCLCATCPARRLQYQQLIKGLQTEAKFSPVIKLTGLRILNDADRARWRIGGFAVPAAPRTRTAVPLGSGR